jgi:hypothetical protein
MKLRTGNFHLSLVKHNRNFSFWIFDVEVLDVWVGIDGLSEFNDWRKWSEVYGWVEEGRKSEFVLLESLMFEEVLMGKAWERMG